MLEPAQLTGDGGQGGGDDGLIEGGEKETQHQTAEDQQDLTMGHRVRGCDSLVQ